MSAFRNMTQGFRNLWGQGGDDDYEDIVEDADEDVETSAPTSRISSQSHTSASSSRDYSSRESQEYTPREPVSTRDSYPPAASYVGQEHEPEASPRADYPRFTTPAGVRRPEATSAPAATPITAGSGGSGNTGARKPRPVAIPMRSREKNIYTLKPKSMDEAGLAADYLKTGCAVVLNLDDLDRFVAIRMVDFMSGVCYGLDNQGHAMKLGESIFLFTPGDYEISSDETDYGENRDPLFKNVNHGAPASVPTSAGPAAPSPSTYSNPASHPASSHPAYSNAPVSVAANVVAASSGSSSSERRSWER